MEKEEIKKYLKQAFWDRIVDNESLLNILDKKTTITNDITIDKIYIRLLESYSWYTILDMIKADCILEILDESITSKIWNKPLKLKYEYARRLLSR